MVFQAAMLSPYILQIPVGSGKEFTGLIDLLSMKIFMWNKKSDEFNWYGLRMNF